MGGEHPSANNDLALLYASIGNISKAIYYFEKAVVDKQGIFPEASYNLAYSYSKIGNNEKAVENYNKAIIDNGGEYPQASCNLGVIYNDLGCIDKAIDCLEKAVVDNQGNFPEASYNLAYSYSEIGNNEKAMENYNKAIIDNGGKYPQASCNLGVIYNDLGCIDKAIDYFEKAIIDNQGKYSKASNNLGVIYDDLGDTEKAIDCLEKAVVDNQGKYPEASNNLGVIYDKLGNIEKAIDNYNKAIIDNGGKYPDASYNLGALQIELLYIEKAISNFEKAIKDNLGIHPKANCILGRIYSEISDYKDTKKAIYNFKKAISDSVKQIYPEAHYYLSVLLKKNGKYKEARKNAFLALEQDKENNYLIVDNIIENYTTKETRFFYQSKQDYNEYYKYGTYVYKSVLSVDEKIILDKIKKRKDFKNHNEQINKLLVQCIMTNVKLFPENDSVNNYRFLYLYLINKKYFGKALYVLEDIMNAEEYLPIDYYFWLQLTYRTGNDIEFFLYMNNELPIFNSDIEKIRQSIESKKKIDEYLFDIKLSNFSELTPFLSKLMISNREVKLLETIISEESYNIDIAELIGRVNDFFYKKNEIEEEKDETKLIALENLELVLNNRIQSNEISSRLLKRDINRVRTCIYDENSYQRVLVIINQLRFKHEQINKNELLEKYIAILLGASYLTLHFDVFKGALIKSKTLSEIIGEILNYSVKEVMKNVFSLLLPFIYTRLQALLSLAIIFGVKKQIKSKDGAWVENLIKIIDI